MYFSFPHTYTISLPLFKIYYHSLHLIFSDYEHPILLSISKYPTQKIQSTSTNTIFSNKIGSRIRHSPHTKMEHDNNVTRNNIMYTFLNKIENTYRREFHILLTLAYVLYFKKLTRRQTNQLILRRIRQLA